jgi:hypothetical protein
MVLCERHRDGTEICRKGRCHVGDRWLEGMKMRLEGCEMNGSSRSSGVV